MSHGMIDPGLPFPARRLVVVLGDQLDRDSAVFDAFDPSQDLILMCEAVEEATYVPQHKRRIALFFAAMRHFADDQRAAGRPILYWRLDDPDAPTSLPDALRRAATRTAPARVAMVEPGDWRVRELLRLTAQDLGVPVDWVSDRHFLSTPDRFADLAQGRKRFILEDFYRAERRRTGLLMDGDAPVGGAWNFDKENRKPFGREGPGLTPERARFEPDATTRAVLAMVAERFPAAPGSLQDFAEPVTPRQAEAALDDFIVHRLPAFGDHQDAMALGRRTLNHARLSAAMNLKLLRPEHACRAAVRAYEAGRAPLNAVEGFVRQILGWREFVRGVYATRMPEYAGLNALDAQADVPAFFWSGETEMACVGDGVSGLLREGYAHHIERLMVLGLFQMLLGVHPYRVHDWHMGLYLDAVDWVSLPNVLGMSQHGDGGVVGTKPYAASGAYIARMSDACRSCRYDPKQAVGPKACPFTTLYWDFLDRHAARFRPNRRMKLQIANLDRKDDEERKEIRKAAAALTDRIAAGAPV